MQTILIPYWLTVSVIIISTLYFFYRVWPLPQIRLYNLKLNFFRAIIRVTTINDTSNDGAKGYTWDELNKLSWEELKLDFKRLMDKNPRFKRRYRNATELFEECLYYIDTKGTGQLKIMTDLEIKNNTRGKIIQLIKLARNENPFLGLPSKEANLLSMINQAIADNNIELGRNSLIQLSQEVEKTVITLETQERRNIVSYIISIVGIILTIIFGLISLKPFFFK